MKDQDNFISYQDFQKVLASILKLPYTKAEIDIYWAKIKPNGGNLSREEFFTKFIPYFDQNDSMNYTKNKFMEFSMAGDDMPINKMAMMNQQVNKFLENNTANLNAVIHQDPIQIIASKISRYIKDNAYVFDCDSLIANIDPQYRQTLSRADLKANMLKLGAGLAILDVDNLIDFLQSKREGAINVDELKKLLKTKIVNELRKLEVQEAEQKGLIDRFVKFLIDYMQMKGKGFSDTFRELDLNHDNKIQSKEIANFFTNTLKLPISENEKIRFFERFDHNGDGVIDYIEFVDEIKKHMTGRMILLERVDTTVQNILSPIVTYMLQQNLSEYDAFIGMDQGTGLVQKEQLNQFLKRARVSVNEKELSLVFDFIDREKKGRFNYQRFSDVLNAIRSKMDKESTKFDVTYPYLLDELRIKIKTILQNTDHSRQLEKMFAMYNEIDGTISKSNFKMVLTNLLTTPVQGHMQLTEDEIDLLINSDLIDKKGNHINYKRFLLKFREKDIDTKSVDLSMSKLNESEFISSADKDRLKGFSAGSRSAIIREGNTIFKSLANIIKSNKELTKEKIFKILDKDGDKKITKVELL